MKYRSLSIRILSVVSVIVILMSCVAVPSYAASDDDSTFFDVLDFGTANGSGYQYVTGSFPMQVVYQTIPEAFRYIDMVVTSDCSDLNINYGGSDLNRLLISSEGLYRYRFYGDLLGDSSGYLIFTLNGSSGSTVIFESMKVSQYDLDMSIIPSVGTLLASPYQYNPREEMTNPDMPVSITLKQESYVNYYKDFWGEVLVTDWKKFDYVDVLIGVRAASIDGITVDIDDVYIPHTISYMDSSLAPDTSWDDSQMFGDFITYNILVRLDLREVNRDMELPPSIHIRGMYAPYWNNQWVQLVSVTGVVVSDPISPLGTLWSRIQGLFVGLFSDLKLHLTSLLQPDQAGQNIIDDTNQTLDDFESEIGDLPDVDIDEALPDNSIIDDIADVNPFAEFFRNLIQNPVIYNAMRITLGFCFINFLWFGRR